MSKRSDSNKNNKKNELSIFSCQEFGQIRTIIVNNEPIFCLGDLCKALELTAKGVKQRLSDEVISNYPIEDSLGRRQNTLFVNEDGLYDVILESRKENAREFRKWITSDVLPTIRKTGGYINNVDLMVNTYFSDVPDEQKSLVKGLLVNIEEKQKKIVSLNNENDLLAQKNLEWADRPLINSLVRAYASSIGDFGKAWNNFKKELLYKHGINLNSRITNYLNTTGKKTKPKTLDMIDDSELANAISTAVSLCRENDVEIDDLLNNKAD